MWEWQQNSGWRKRGRKKAALSGQTVFGQKVKVHGWQEKFISFCFPSEQISVSGDFSSVPFNFVVISGFSLTPNNSGCVANFAEILGQKWNCRHSSKHILNSKMNRCFLLRSRWQRKLCLSFHKIEETKVYILAGRWHLQHPKIFLPHNAIYISLTMTIWWRLQEAFYAFLWM